METQITDQGTVNLEIQNGIATVEFGHPKSNSLPGKILRSTAETISSLNVRDEVNVIVLKTTGERAFCAGASFDELIAINDLETGKRFFMGFAQVINACRNSPKLIIGRVQGKTVGGGVGIAAACDYTFATKFASIKLSELAIGIGPFVVGPAVERKLGTAAFSYLAINAREWQTAEWARENGLFAEVFDSIEEMDKAINRLAETLAQSNPEAMAMMKRAFWQGAEHWDQLLEERAETSGRLVLSDFTRNAIASFKAGAR